MLEDLKRKQASLAKDRPPDIRNLIHRNNNPNAAADVAVATSGDKNAGAKRR